MSYKILLDTAAPPPPPSPPARRPRPTPPPVWVRIGFGHPRCDAEGVPLYEPWEYALDAVVHLASVLWGLASAIVVLTQSLETRFVLYSTFTLLIFFTSAAYNVLGCARRVATERLRRLDQAAIFLSFAGAYNVFVTDWRLLVGLWTVCGSAALLKLALGRQFESTAMLVYATLLVAPMVAVRPHARAFPTLLGAVSAVAAGAVFGYFNNERGGVVIWHACVLASNITFWTLVYGATQHGVEYYL